MADWFFDPGATGTGSADTPANAGTNIISIWSYVASAWTFGDRMWLRRSSVATWNNTNSLWALGALSWNANTAAYSWIIGWPKSGEPFYSQRPSSAISAGWDSDVNTVYPDINMATFFDASSSGFSRSHGFQSGTGLANLLFACNTATYNFPELSNSGPFVPKLNNHWLNYRPANNTFSYRDLTITVAGSQWANTGSNIIVMADKLTVTASSIITRNFFSGNVSFRIKEFELLSNSIHSLSDVTNFPPSIVPNYIGVARGNRWKIDVGSSSFANQNAAIRPTVVDDYFGDGPVTIIGRRAPEAKIVRPGTVTANSQNAISMIMTSSGGGSGNAAFANIVQAISVPGRPLASAREFIQWSNSAELVIRWPFLQVGTSGLNAAVSGMPHQMQALGLGIMEVELVASSGFVWAGDSASGVGSAWVAIGRARPTQAGSGFIDLAISPYQMANNEVIYFGRPEVNSA